MQRSVELKGKLICFDDKDRTDKQAMEVLKANGKSAFAKDLMRKRKLTQKQWTWVHYLVYEMSI